MRPPTALIAAERAAQAARDQACAQYIVNSQLIAACKRGDTEEAVHLVTTCGAEVRSSNNISRRKPLHTAAQEGHADTARALVSRLGADVNSRRKAFAGRTPLHDAVASSAEGATETVRLLVEELGASVDARDNSGCTPLLMAAQRAQFEMVLLLARLGADVNAVAEPQLNSDDSNSNAERSNSDADGSGGDADDVGGDKGCQKRSPTALHFAAGSGRMDVIWTLVKDFGAAVNAVDEDGKTPLHFAALCGKSEAAVALVREFGADVEAKTLNGHTPLHIAVLVSRSEIVKVLVDKLGASLLTPNDKGLAPLHVAADNCDVEAVRLLLTRGADPSAPAPASGWTPLHFAGRHGSSGASAVVEALLEHGADPDATDGNEKEPHTAAFFAAMSGDERVCMVLADARSAC